MILAVAMQKGGVGKTTTAVNLAVAMARRIGEGARVLVADMDPQAHATLALGLDKRGDHPAVGDVLMGRTPTAEVIRETPFGVDLLPASLELAVDEQKLSADHLGAAFRLREALNTVRQRYAHVVIDCPPSLGILTICSLTAADRYLIPLEPLVYGADGLTEILATAERVRRYTNPDLKAAGIVINRWDRRNQLGHQVVEGVRTSLGGQVPIFHAYVVDTVSLAEAPGAGVPAAFYRSRNRSHRQALESYGLLAREILGEEVRR
ncbi:MAG: AAA family ATPase [Thermaerobacter sp.]|nr:AAA family ATPase [Thermaerobacter sp.]